MKLTLKNLGFGYNGQVLSDFINLEVEDKDYIVIMGDNGSGKSTLVKTILGLNKKISGDIILEGITKDEIAYLPQLISIAEDFPTTIFELVLSGFKIKKRFFYTKEEKERALQCLEKFGILDLKDRRFSSLSGGQKQRVLLARSFVEEKKLLILDEPLAGLDPDAQESLYKMLEELNKSAAIIMISHDAGRAASFAKKVIKLENQHLKVEKGADSHELSE